MLLLLGATSGCSLISHPQAIGSEAPNFTVTLASDASKKVTLKDLRGKVVVIDFWATWCGPCKEAMPHLQKLYDDNHDKGVEVLAITTEDPSKVHPYEMITNLHIPFYTDEAREANGGFDVQGLPTTVVIGKDGKIVYSVMGENSEIETEIDNAVANALK